MRFLRIDEVPLAQLMVFRVSPVGLAVMVFLVLLMAGLTGWQAVGRPWLWLCVVLLVLVLAHLIRDMKRAFGQAGWLAAIGRDKLYLKWRPYQNTHLSADDLQVVEVELRRIASTQFVSRWSLGEYSAHGDDCVELTFSSSVDPKPLGEMLLAEQRKGKTRGQYPLILHSEKVLRIQWQAWPGARHFIRVLESREIPVGG